MKRRMPQASSDGVTAPTLNKDSLVIEDKGKIILKFIVCKSGGRFPPRKSRHRTFYVWTDIKSCLRDS